MLSLSKVFKINMDTSFLASAQEITSVILEVIKRMYQGKHVSLYIYEGEQFVSEQQIEEVRRKDAFIGSNPVYLLDCNPVMNKLKKELEAMA
jgi:hypothetical protein